MILSVVFGICALVIFLVSLKARFKFARKRLISTPCSTSTLPQAMAESLPYQSTNSASSLINHSPQPDCKYSYATWCPTCERDSPRRRSNHTIHQQHSNTVQLVQPAPCRRRQRDMKSLHGGSLSGSRTSENDYEMVNENVNRAMGECFVNGEEAGYGCCVGGRSGGRANLCELPTTYISGLDNCQKVSTGCAAINCHHQNSTTQPSNIPAYLNKSTNTINISPSINQNPIESTTSTASQDINNSISTSYDYVTSTEPLQMSHQSTKTIQLSNPTTPMKSKTHLESPHKMDLNSVFFDTCTYLDRATYNAELTSNLRERYQLEMETLRNKLKELKSGRFNSNLHSSLTVKNLDKLPADTSSSEIRIIENVKEYKKNLKAAITGGKADGKEILNTKKDVAVRSTASRLSVKTRSKLSAVKMRKRKSKDSSKRAVGKNGMYGGSVSSSDFTESECSDSDAEYSKEEDLSILDESEASTVLGGGEGEAAAAGDKKQRSRLAVSSSTRVPAKLGVAGAAGDQGVNWPLRESLFAHVPPYISFNSYDATSPYVLPNGKKYLKWKLSTITPVVVRRTLVNTGFTLVRSEFSRESNDWCGTWGKHMKSPMFKTLKGSQKLNHFAGTFQIGRKDRLWRNMQRLAMKHGVKEFGFLPQTFVLPQDLKLLKHSWMYKNGSGGEKWIIKPPASARGVGIKVINRWSQLPKRMSLIVQRYISDPYLINGSKFDLRLYVLVTSFNPLRIYLYPDGLARFASTKYSSDDRDLRDRYMHLTNYSINKLSSQYTANEDANACQGHKWTLTKLWDYLSSKGINTRQIQSNLNALVIKTILSGESPIVQLCAENVTTRYNCYELFGVDVLLDADLRPWLLEVNISPSLHSASPLDAHVKGPLVKALMNLVQFHLPPRVKKIIGSPPVLDLRLYSTLLSKKERIKHDKISQIESRQEYLNEVLDNLTGDDIRVLLQAEDELIVKGPFERIFPTAKTYKYLEFIEPRYYNRLFDAWECMFEKNRKPGIKMLQSLCIQKVHLKFPKESNSAKKSQSMINTLLANLEAPPTEERNYTQSRSTEPQNDCEEGTSTCSVMDITTTTKPLITAKVSTKVKQHNQHNGQVTVDSTTAVAIVA